MLFKNYEYFLTIAEEGSVSKAAERLYISQPSLSKYLKRLEERIGLDLFNRESYPLRLTSAGELYLNYVKDIVKKEKRLLLDFADIQNMDSGTVSIGLTVWRSSIILPLVLPHFKKRYPKIEVEVYEGSHQYLASLLEHDKVDFVICHLPNQFQNVTFEHLHYEKILFCMNEMHPFLQRIGKQHGDVRIMSMGNNDFIQFSEEPFILLKQGQNLRDITQNFFNKLGQKPNIALETSNIVTAINAAKKGLGVTFAPEAVLRSPEQSQRLIFFSVDNPPLQWEVGFAFKTGIPLRKHVQLFMDCIREYINIPAG